jgi:enamine deaminase RidA (YjgF/YER057c/UK114 family)
VATCPRDGFAELYVTVAALNGEEPSAMFQRLADRLSESKEAQILRKDVFGLVNTWGDDPRPHEYSADGIQWPVTWVLEEGGQGSGPMSGIHVQAVEGVPVKPIRMGGRVVGTVFENGHARWCFLGGITPEDATLGREQQARRTFEMMEEALALAGMDFSHVARTWLFIDSILAWYDEFNKVRTAFFKERKVFDGLVPASTGIGGANYAGTAVVADVMAIQPTDDNVRIEALPSPLQCPALEYGSSFSRAVEVVMPDHRRVIVSGTASIHPDGRTAHLGDVDKQVELTMEVVAAILESRGMSWPDVTRAVAYFKHEKDAPAFDRYREANGIAALPVVIVKNDICRDELLFEVEVDAARC